MVKILHTADLHLGAGSSIGGKKRVEDFIESFKRIVDLAIKEEVDLVLIAGDIFHTPRPSSTVFYAFAEQTKRLFEKNIKVVAVAGNHDVPRSLEDKSFLEALAEYSDKMFIFIKRPCKVTIESKEGKKISIVGIPYLNPIYFTLPDVRDEIGYRRKIRNTVKSLLEDTDADYKILLGHLMTEWATFGSEKIFVGDKDIRISNQDILAHEFDYVALGHVHKPQSRDNVYYAGSIERIDFSEAKEKKRVLILSENYGKVVPTEYRIPVRAMVSAALAVKDPSKIMQDIYRILLKVKNINDDYEILPPLLKLKLILKKGMNINIKNIEDYIRDKVYYLKITTEYEIVKPSDIKLYSKEKPLHELIKTYIKKLCETSFDLKDLEEELTREALSILEEVNT